MIVATAEPQKKASKGRPRKYCSGEELTSYANSLGVSENTILQYFARGCPYDSVESITRWRALNIQAVSDCADLSELGAELKRAELAKKLGEARAIEIKNEQSVGSLVSKADIQEQLSILLARFRDQLHGLPQDCAAVVNAEYKPVIHDLVANRCEVMLKQLVDAVEGL